MKTMEIKIKEGSTYEFDTDQYGFPTFTEKNREFLNGILKYDSNYSTSSDKASPEYKSSYAGILEKDGFFDFAKTAPTAKNDELIVDDLYRVIVSIDKINSTHLSSEGKEKSDDAKAAKGDNGKKEKRNKGRIKVANFIRTKYGGEKLKKALEKADDDIVKGIADPKIGGKHNFSFATKFCSYVSLHALEKKYKDNYCIYDEILQSVLPYYAYMYADITSFGNQQLYKSIAYRKRKSEAEDYSELYVSVNNGKEDKYRNESLVREFKEKENYGGYRELIKEIIKGIKKKLGIDVTFEDFDHLVWYCFKGSKTKIQMAMNKLPKIETKKTT